MNIRDKILRWSETSIFLICIRCLKHIYRITSDTIGSAYACSFTYRINNAVKIIFKYSIFGRLTQIEDSKTRNYLETSKVVKIIVSCVIRVKRNANKILFVSKTKNILGELTDMFLRKPVNFLSIIVIIVILINVLLCVISGQPVDTLGWLLRGVLLCAGISGMFSSVDWQALKGSSIILRNLEAE